MSLYVVITLVFTVTIVIQGHTCNDLTGIYGGGYAVVMWESMEQKKIAATSLMIILACAFLKGRVYQTDIDLSLMIYI